MNGIRIRRMSSTPVVTSTRTSVCSWVFAFGLWAYEYTIFMPHLRHWNGNRSMLESIKRANELEVEVRAKREKPILLWIMHFVWFGFTAVAVTVAGGGSGASSWLNPKKKQNWVYLPSGQKLCNPSVSTIRVSCFLLLLFDPHRFFF